MSASPPVNLPRVIRPRPTDATGLFWAFVALLFGLFYAFVFPPLAIVLVAIPFCLVWQIKQWRSDASIARAATNWSQTHYPDAGGTPVVDFMIAVAHHFHLDFDDSTANTTLASLNWMLDGDEEAHLYPEFQHFTQVWLDDVFADAKIRGIDLTIFSGTTLGNAIDLLLAARKRGSPRDLRESRY